MINKLKVVIIAFFCCVSVGASELQKFDSEIEEILKQAQEITRHNKEGSFEKYNLSLQEFDDIISSDLENKKTIISNRCTDINCSVASEVNEDSKVIVFTSLSVPFASWKEHSNDLIEIDGSFILRGLPDNSFKSFFSFIKKMRKKTVEAPIGINPDLFELYKITSVPCIVVIDGDQFDKIEGNVPIDYALKQFALKGDCSKLASSLLKQLKEAV